MTRTPHQNILSRRAFLSRAAALGLASLLPSQTEGKTIDADTPQKGGQLRMGLAGGGR